MSSNWSSLTNPVAPVLSYIVEARSLNSGKRYSSILKGYTVSKSSRLYSFQSKRVLLPYLSVTMHFTQYQRGTILFADYYVVACCT